MPEEPTLGPVARRLAATRRVLCVEDEADIAGFLRAYFRAAGYDLVHVDPTDPDEVLVALDQHVPDCVLLDVRLRGFSGIDAYRRVRSDDRWAFTPVVLVSGLDVTSETTGGLDAFVPKPFNTNVLADLVGERIDTANELADRIGGGPGGLLGPDYLRARLADEIAIAGPLGHVSFALVRLGSVDQVVGEVGRDGFDFLVRATSERLRDVLPADAVVGSTGPDELAVVLPGGASRDAYAALRAGLDALGGEHRFAGGAVVPVDLTGGIAAYPDSATEPDGLFMAADAALADAVEGSTVLQRSR